MASGVGGPGASGASHATHLVAAASLRTLHLAQTLTGTPTSDRHWRLSSLTAVMDSPRPTPRCRPPLLPRTPRVENAAENVQERTDGVFGIRRGRPGETPLSPDRVPEGEGTPLGRYAPSTRPITPSLRGSGTSSGTAPPWSTRREAGDGSPRTGVPRLWGVPHATSNRMELQAVLEALRGAETTCGPTGDTVSNPFAHRATPNGVHVSQESGEPLQQAPHQVSQPTPSRSVSKPWGSEPVTVKLRCSMSPQFRSGGGGGMQTVG